jgi:hypothetical protein
MNQRVELTNDFMLYSDFLCIINALFLFKTTFRRLDYSYLRNGSLNKNKATDNVQKSVIVLSRYTSQPTLSLSPH